MPVQVGAKIALPMGGLALFSVGAFLVFFAAGWDNFITIRTNNIAGIWETDHFGIYTAHLNGPHGLPNSGTILVDCGKGINGLWCPVVNEVGSDCETVCNAKKICQGFSIFFFSASLLIFFIHAIVPSAAKAKFFRKAAVVCGIIAVAFIWGVYFTLYTEMGREYTMNTGSGATYDGDFGTCKYKLEIGDGATLTDVRQPQMGNSFKIGWAGLTFSTVGILLSAFGLMHDQDNELYDPFKM